MAGFSGISDVVTSEDFGQVRYSTWRKAPTLTTPQGIWFDLSMSPGNPSPQYYAAAPLTAIALTQSTNGGLFHGGPVSPQVKCLRQMSAIGTAAIPLPMSIILADYLMFYPFIDESITDVQSLTNTVPLPRYPTGEGVQMMAVSVAVRAGGQSFIVGYTNSEGVSGRVSQTVIQNTGSVTGSIVTSERAASALQTGPFIGLQTGDSGVRSIDSVTMSGVDSGLFTLVLVRPLAQLSVRGIDAPVEVDYLKDCAGMPVVKDDAYLNLICNPSGSVGFTTLTGDAKFVWN